jgi:hypothetical protein
MSTSGWEKPREDRQQNGSHSVAAADRQEANTELSTEVKSMEKAKKEAFSAMGDMSDINASFQKNAKRVAAWYIDTVENLAKEGLILREKSTSWAKDTPLAAIFEAQNAMAQQLVENSASFARSIFQLDREEEKIKRSVEA